MIVSNVSLHLIIIFKTSRYEVKLQSSETRNLIYVFKRSWSNTQMEGSAYLAQTKIANQ